jgi:hypothetical protein
MLHHTDGEAVAAGDDPGAWTGTRTLSAPGRDRIRTTDPIAMLGASSHHASPPRGDRAATAERFTHKG